MPVLPLDMSGGILPLDLPQDSEHGGIQQAVRSRQPSAPPSVQPSGGDRAGPKYTGIAASKVPAWIHWLPGGGAIAARKEAQIQAERDRQAEQFWRQQNYVEHLRGEANTLDSDLDRDMQTIVAQQALASNARRRIGLVAPGTTAYDQAMQDVAEKSAGVGLLFQTIQRKQQRREEIGNVIGGLVATARMPPQDAKERPELPALPSQPDQEFTRPGDVSPSEPRSKAQEPGGATAAPAVAAAETAPQPSHAEWAMKNIPGIAARRPQIEGDRLIYDSVENKEEAEGAYAAWSKQNGDAQLNVDFEVAPGATKDAREMAKDRVRVLREDVDDYQKQLAEWEKQLNDPFVQSKDGKERKQEILDKKAAVEKQAKTARQRLEKAIGMTDEESAPPAATDKRAAFLAFAKKYAADNGLSRDEMVKRAKEIRELFEKQNR